MKKIIFITAAVTLMLAGFAGQSSAGVNVHIGLFGPAPVYVAPVPVYERHVVVEEPDYYYAPVRYHYVREGWYRDHDRWDRDRYWDHRNWHRDRDDGRWGGNDRW